MAICHPISDFSIPVSHFPLGVRNVKWEVGCGPQTRILIFKTLPPVLRSVERSDWGFINGPSIFRTDIHCRPLLSVHSFWTIFESSAQGNIQPDVRNLPRASRNLSFISD